MAQETYFKKLMESPKIARHLIENYLLSDGFFDIFMVLQDKKLQVTFELIEKDLLYLLEEKFAVCKIQIENITGDIILIFLSHPDFTDAVLGDASLQNKAPRPISFDRKKIESRIEKINHSNRELLYQFLKERGTDLVTLRKISERTFNSFLINKPFLQYYNVSATALQIGKKYSAPFDMTYFRKLLVKKKAELFLMEKMRIVKEHLYSFFETTYYARMSQLGVILEGLENKATDLDIKHIIYTSPKDFLILGIKSMASTPVAEYHKYRAYIKDGQIEVMKGNQIYPLENILKYEALAFELLSPLYNYKANLTYPANIQAVPKKVEDKIYIIRKNKVSLVVSELLRKGDFIENERNYATLLLFYTLMYDYSKSPSKIMILKAAGKVDTNYHLGFSSEEELKGVIKKIEKILTVKTKTEILIKHLGVIKKKKGTGILSLIFHFLFARKTEQDVLKKLNSFRKNIKEVSGEIVNTVYQEQTGTRAEVINLVLHAIDERAFSKPELQKLKQTIMKDPVQLLQFTNGAATSFLNDLLKNDKDKSFAKEVVNNLNI